MHELQQFLPAELKTGKSWFISYYAYNPSSKKLDRKRVKINKIKSIPERRRYARELIKNINEKLYSGWNPFIDPEAKKCYVKLSDAMEHFWRIAEKKLAEDSIREETYRDYVSYPKNFLKWLNQIGKKDLYVYELERTLVVQFLEHIYIERDNTTTTRNNYLSFLRVFATFLMEHEYLKHRFTDGISNIKRNKKKRAILETSDLNRLRKYLKANNKYFLLACEIQYYLFIRPKELSKIRISEINIEKSLIYVPFSKSKNRNDGWMTIPGPLLNLIVELKIMQNPGNYFLFSVDYKPGEKYRSEKFFRDFWLNRVRKELGFPDTYKFYSLKDTGISDMIAEVGDLIMVRDQARHSSIAITNIYAQGRMKKANETIKNLKY